MKQQKALAGTFIAALGVALSSVPAVAQKTTSPDAPAVPVPQFEMSFEVASVKLSKPGAASGEKHEGGRFTANLSLFGYITFAWDLMPSKEQTDSMLARAPGWAFTDHYEIRAVAKGNPTTDQMRLMVRSLLADRFGLRIHTITAEAAVLALIPDKPGATGPKLRPHSAGQPCNVPLPLTTNSVGVFPPACEELLAIPAEGGGILVAARDVTLEKIATFVSSLGILSRPVIDQTGLSGRFDFTIEFTPERRGPAPQPDAKADDLPGTTLQEALRDQLGLKLKATKAPLDSLVVDHAERPSEN